MENLKESGVPSKNLIVVKPNTNQYSTLEQLNRHFIKNVSLITKVYQTPNQSSPHSTTYPQAGSSSTSQAPTHINVDHFNICQTGSSSGQKIINQSQVLDEIRKHGMYKRASLIPTAIIPHSQAAAHGNVNQLNISSSTPECSVRKSVNPSHTFPQANVTLQYPVLSKSKQSKNAPPSKFSISTSKPDTSVVCSQPSTSSQCFQTNKICKVATTSKIKQVNGMKYVQNSLKKSGGSGSSQDKQASTIQADADNSRFVILTKIKQADGLQSRYDKFSLLKANKSSKPLVLLSQVQNTNNFQSSQNFENNFPSTSQGKQASAIIQSIPNKTTSSVSTSQVKQPATSRFTKIDTTNNDQLRPASSSSQKSSFESNSNNKNIELTASTSGSCSSKKSTSHVISSGTLSQNNVESTPSTRFGRKVMITEDGISKTIYSDSTNLRNARKITFERNTENEFIKIDDVDQDTIMQLINKRYGDSLEAQIPPALVETAKKAAAISKADPPPETIQEILTDLDPTSSPPSDIFQYKLREEQLIDMIDREQQILQQNNDRQQTVDESNKQQLIIDLTIDDNDSKLIETLDSPKKDCKLFTRQELERLPVKVLASPIKLQIKKEETIDDIIPLENFKIKSEEPTEGTYDRLETMASPKLSPIKTEVLKVEATEYKDEKKDDKKLLKMDLKHLDVTLKYKPENYSSLEDIKKIDIAKEDITMFQEMDRFIEDMNKDKILSKTEMKDFENLNPNEEIITNDGQRSVPLQSNISNLITVEVSNDVIVESEPANDLNNSKETREDTTTLLVSPIEDGNKKIEDNQPALPTENLRSEQAREEIQTNKNDVFVKLVQGLQQETEENEILNNRVSNKTVKKTVTNKEISTKKIYSQKDIGNENKLTKVSNNSNELNTAGPSEVLQCNHVDNSNTQLEKNPTEEVTPDPVKLIQCSNISEDFSTVSSDIDYEIMIINENGFLEPITTDDNLPPVSSKTVQQENSEKTVETKENEGKVPKDQIKEEILSLLEKAQTNQQNLSRNFKDDNNISNAKLKFFLKEQIKLLKNMFEKLEIFSESAQEDCNNHNSTLKSNLYFIKNILDKSCPQEQKKIKYNVVRITQKNPVHKKPKFVTTVFPRQEKKLKYKVIRITKTDTVQRDPKLPKRKRVTKKIYKKRSRKVVRNKTEKFQRRTLYRMRRIREALVENRELFKKIEKNASDQQLSWIMTDNYLLSSKLGKILKDCDSFKSRKSKYEINEKEQLFTTNKSEIETIGTAAGRKESNKGSDVNGRTLTVVLERSDNVVKYRARQKDTDPQKPDSDASSLEKEDQKDDLLKKVTLPAENIEKITMKEKNYLGFKDELKIQCETERKEVEIKQDDSKKYCLRSRKAKNITSGANCLKDEADIKFEGDITYEVDYSSVMPLDKKSEKSTNYILRSNNKPCASSSVLKQTGGVTTRGNCLKNLKKDAKENESKHTGTKTKKYDTRNKATKDTGMTLRSSRKT